jgi:hypothetical protein
LFSVAVVVTAIGFAIGALRGNFNLDRHDQSQAFESGAHNRLLIAIIQGSAQARRGALTIDNQRRPNYLRAVSRSRLKFLQIEKVLWLILASSD